MATLGLIEYKDASSEVRAVYDDIMATRKTDWINNFWKALANDPATLKRTWADIKQIMAPGALDALTKELIYVAVSVTNQCEYCIASHTSSARNKGMTDDMFRELMAVVGMANETNRLANPKILARFDKGDPAVLQLAVGKGTLLLLTAGWHPADSQLALSSKFVPILYSLLQQSGSIKTHRSQYLVGDNVLVASTPTGDTVSIQPPQGAPIPLNGADHFTDTALPGIYASSMASNSWRFAVNVPPEESKTAPIPIEELQRLGLPLKLPLSHQVQQLEQKKRLENVELEARQKLWKWLIVAALVVLMLETWVAGYVSRRATAGATV